MATAWMLRNDGKLFPVDHHIYADPEDTDDILRAAQWLYLNTGCVQVRMIIARMYALWAWKRKPRATALDTLVKYASENEGFFPDKSFIEGQLGSALETMDHREKLHPSGEDVDDYCSFALMWLNQEYLRVRYGGMYDSEKGCKDIIFRISSVGFDWYPYIQGFVGTTRLDIDTVTIVRDAESTGAGNAAYRALDGKHLYNRMPGREFLDERNSQTAPKNHLYYMEGATNARVRGARASLFEGRLRQGCGMMELSREIRRLLPLENQLVSCNREC